MPARIVIQHTGGAKATQVEAFPLRDGDQLILGRDPGAAIMFDPAGDDAVSRQHAAILVRDGDPPSFRIVDLGSRNGTRVNGRRVAGAAGTAAELYPGDVVELGAGGPSFTFDIDPGEVDRDPGRQPGDGMPVLTRIMSSVPDGATRVLGTPVRQPPAPSPGLASRTASPPSAGGDAWVVAQLVAQRRRSNRMWSGVLAGFAVLAAAGGYGLYYHFRRQAEQTAVETASVIAAQRAELVRVKAAADGVSTVKSAREIARDYRDATVVIDVNWRLYDKASGKPLSQVTRMIGRQRLPCYVETPDGRLARWLTIDDPDQTGISIGASGRGTAFVVSPDGRLLTNKHVAAGWTTRYGEKETLDKGAIFKLGSSASPRIMDMTPNTRAAIDLYNWVPSSGGLVFRAEAPVPIDDRGHEFEGRSDLMEIRFPGETQSQPAQLVRLSRVADVAELRIEARRKLRVVELAADDDVQLGDKVIVLGYPVFSAPSFAMVRSGAAGQPQMAHRQEVAEPTVTEGLVSYISAAPPRTDGAAVMSSAIAPAGLPFGQETYQLTVPSGSGNSGGPVFNTAGKVIGLFTFGSSRETVTYAVPIRFGRDLLLDQRLN